MQIYYAKDDTQVGPIQINDLKPHEITKETLVWYEGLADWMPAKNIEALSGYFAATPPPLKKSPSAPVAKEKKYDKRTDAIGFGIIVFLLPYGLYILLLNIEKPAVLIFCGLLTLLIWARAIQTVYKIAKEQNRGTDWWLIYAVLLPALALITIGFLDRKPKKSTYLQALDAVEEE
jgi:hypothetical protein